MADEEEFSALNKTLKETTKFLKEKAAADSFAADRTAAVLENVAKGDGRTKEVKAAKKEIAKQEKAENKGIHIYKVLSEKRYNSFKNRLI